MPVHREAVVRPGLLTQLPTARAREHRCTEVAAAAAGATATPFLQPGEAGTGFSTGAQRTTQESEA